MMEIKRDIALKIAWHYLGTPYRWGGDDFSGFDCSGFVIEILKSVGILARGVDLTAHGLWTAFKEKCEVQSPDSGTLVFWTNKSGQKILHVEMCINDELSIGASGGGRNIKTVDDAIKFNAFIKVRPFRSRPHIKGFIDPFSECLM